MQEIISVRELQRNYRTIINRAKRTKKPVFLGRYHKPEVAILDMGVYETVYKHKPKRSWAEIKKTLDWIKAGGKQNVNLAEFVRKDRQSH